MSNVKFTYNTIIMTRMLKDKVIGKVYIILYRNSIIR